MNSKIKVHYFQHIEDEGYGSLEIFFRKIGAEVTSTKFYTYDINYILPRVDEIDFLIVMGGAMSVNDESGFPWLVQEKRWILEFIESGKPTIGLSLGAQLIANVLGAEISKNKFNEVGWWEVQKTVVSKNFNFQVFNFPDYIFPFHWHNETFRLPLGAILLAGSVACKNQVFQYKNHVIGFQFHPEITKKVLDLYLADKEEFKKFNGNYVQNYEQLKSSEMNLFEPANQLLEDAVKFLIKNSFGLTY